MVEVTYLYYTDSYLGTSLSSDDFTRYLKKARYFVDNVTFGRVSKVEDDDTDSTLIVSIRDCLCECAEYLKACKSNDNMMVTSESLGPISKSYKDTSVPNSVLNGVARIVDVFLGNTNLTYLGI